MNGPTRGLRGTLAGLFVALALLTSVASAGAAEAVHYTKESTSAFERQLNAGEIRSAVINGKLRSIRLTLKNGEHVLAHYPKRGRPAVEARIKAKHVSVSVLGKAAANKEAREQPKHHKIRYIAGGALLVVIVIVGGVLLLNRHRRRD
jgi:translation initiation factor IF-1